MFIVKEYQIPNTDFENSDQHKDLLSEINKIIKSVEFENIYKKSILVAIVYGRKPSQNDIVIKDFDKSFFSSKDEIKFSVLRASFAPFYRKYPESKIGDTNFAVVLCFKDNPYSNLSKYADAKSKNSEDTVLNVLPIEPKFNLSQMVLSEKVEKELKDVITLVKLRKKIYDDWGFAEIDPIPRAIINFFGKPGTGKTMAAHALASEFGTKILILNYADIESKYVGDAPKNLMAAFNIAKEHNALLFFDEADSFLGKRIGNVTHSADQAINSLRSQLLMLLEEFNGTVIFATNLIKNYDSAFKSRILKHVQFELPTKELRIALIKKMLPMKMPLENNAFTEERFLELAEKSEGFSGREIKNAVLNGIISSASKLEYFSFDDAVSGFDSVKQSLQNTSGNKEVDKAKLEKKIARNLRKRKIKKTYGKSGKLGNPRQMGPRIGNNYNEVRAL